MDNLLEPVGIMAWARSYWRLTKNINLGALADYDDELASEVRELRAKAHELIFGEALERKDRP